MSARFPIELFEEHSSSLPVWWAQGGAPGTVVYLDAHLDLQETAADGVRALQQCRSIDEVRALEAPHHLESSSRFAYGIENFLYAAHRLGLIERLIWVAPPHVPRGYSPALLEYAQQMDGISFDELIGFQPTGTSSLRGRLLGLDITICDIDDLANLQVPDDYCLDIDTDYFVAVPGDTLWTDPGDAVRGLLDSLGPPRLATVSRAVGSGFMPLHLRFIGDYAAAVLSDDEDTVRHYRDLCAAVRALERGDRGRAAALCRAALQRRPGCAASCFLLAQAVDEIAEQRALRARAAELQPAYGFDLCREACTFPNRRRPLDGRKLRALAGQLASGPPRGDESGFARVAVARLYAEAGMPAEALRLLEAPGAALPENGDVLLAVANAFLAADDPRRAAPLLTRATEYASTRTSATLHLGDLAMRAGQADRARSRYAEVAERAPAWTLPLERLRLCCEALGDAAGARELTARIGQRKSVLAELISADQAVDQ